MGRRNIPNVSDFILMGLTDSKETWLVLYTISPDLPNYCVGGCRDDVDNPPGSPASHPHVFFPQSPVISFFFFLNGNYLFIYLWLCWVFVSVRGLSLVAAIGGHSSSRCAGLSLSRPLLLQSTGSRRAGSVIVAHGPSCSAACGIFPDQGSNPCSLH